MILDESVSRRKAWQQLFLARLTGGFSDQVRSRIIFLSPSPAVAAVGGNNSTGSPRATTSAGVESTIAMLTALAGGHVLLDPFPASSSLLSCLQAVSVGLPIITMPSDSRLAGRLALAVYQLLGYGFQSSSSSSPSSASATSEVIFDMNSNGVLSSRKSGGTGGSVVSGVSGSSKRHFNGGERLVVSSVNEYVSAALSLAHQPRLRERHSAEIMQRKHRLYSSEVRQQAAEDWIQLFNAIAPDEKRGRVSSNNLPFE